MLLWFSFRRKERKEPTPETNSNCLNKQPFAHGTYHFISEKMKRRPSLPSFSPAPPTRLSSHFGGAPSPPPHPSGFPPSPPAPAPSMREIRQDLLRSVIAHVGNGENIEQNSTTTTTTTWWSKQGQRALRRRDEMLSRMKYDDTNSNASSNPSLSPTGGGVHCVDTLDNNVESMVNNRYRQTGLEGFFYDNHIVLPDNANLGSSSNSDSNAMSDEIEPNPPSSATLSNSYGIGNGNGNVHVNDNDNGNGNGNDNGNGNGNGSSNVNQGNGNTISSNSPHTILVNSAGRRCPVCNKDCAVQFNPSDSGGFYVSAEKSKFGGSNANNFRGQSNTSSRLQQKLGTFFRKNSSVINHGQAAVNSVQTTPPTHMQTTQAQMQTPIRSCRQTALSPQSLSQSCAYCDKWSCCGLQCQGDRCLAGDRVFCRFCLTTVWRKDGDIVVCKDCE